MSSDLIDAPPSSSNILSAGDPPDDTPAPPQPEATITTTTTTTTPPTSPHRRRNSVPIPLTFPSLFQTNGSSVSLIHSTAEGRPVPVDHSTAADRTSALRHLNSHFPSSPSRHRYAKSTGAQSTTYSQPVIVRTYPGPRHDPSSPPSGPRSHQYPGGPSRPPPSAPSAIHRIIPFASSEGGPRPRGMLSSLSRSRKRGDEAHLPPVESFTFRSIMNDAQANITTDLDRIAEICARSRYSLSNQYEVHKAPHGSGDAFLSPPPPPDPKSGPTLQAVPSSAPASSTDDGGSGGGERGTKRRRRRRSVAVGTLETIMSSSRSSDEDRSKKRSAAEIADEVRGRAAARRSGDSSPVSAPEGEGGERDGVGEQPRLKRRMSSLANVVVDPEGRGADVGDRGLVSAPAEPETCTDFDVAGDSGDADASRGGILRSLSSWIWRGAGSHAEGSLRELLKSDGKGKGVER